MVFCVCFGTLLKVPCYPLALMATVTAARCRARFCGRKRGVPRRCFAWPRWMGPRCYWRWTRKHRCWWDEGTLGILPMLRDSGGERWRQIMSRSLNIPSPHFLPRWDAKGICLKERFQRDGMVLFKDFCLFTAMFGEDEAILTSICLK